MDTVSNLLESQNLDIIRIELKIYDWLYNK